MCWKGGVTKSFISPTFIQKDKSLLTLNSQLKNSVVWLNHKAIWWTKLHGTTLTYYLKIYGLKNSLQYMAYSSTGFLLKNILYQNKVEWDESSESFMCKFSLWAPKINTDTKIL